MQSMTNNRKKNPPPRPPPPNFSKCRSKSTSLNQQNQSAIGNLIDFSPPSSPKPERTRNFGGSVSSSFNSSTSSLASSKKSLEFEPLVTNNLWPIQARVTHSSQTSNNGITFQSYLTPGGSQTSAHVKSEPGAPSFFVPTIIRPKAKANGRPDDSCTITNSPSGSLPMPLIPPPSPPKDIGNVETPYGLALYDYPATHPSDLALQKDDVVILIRRINGDWLYGKVFDKEGMFPDNFIDIQVPLSGEDHIVIALYDFPPEMPGDLPLKTGQKIKVIKRISDCWLFGESNGQTGQFPSNYINRVPDNL
ncbi:unnamed protein product [Ceutorhynchus assimilis]|uniref:SH3 domain-containing protein n=1 Tax=Ceutorhynchus assimilis TaxID=467358 RepID=A0A9N9MDV7_9CUCU|nr:unnamed protein product [Ceutorhynchus assimilis]